MEKDKETKVSPPTLAINITFIRFFVCFCVIISILFIKTNNTALYDNAKNLYLRNSAQILDKENIINQVSYVTVSSVEFLKICTLKIFRSVTS